MENKMSRILALVVATVVLLGLAGCASSQCGEPPYGAILGGVLQGVGAGLSAL